MNYFRPLYTLRVVFRWALWTDNLSLEAQRSAVVEQSPAVYPFVAVIASYFLRVGIICRLSWILQIAISGSSNLSALTRGCLQIISNFRSPSTCTRG